MVPKKILFKALRTALVVGSILPLINQSDALFGGAEFRWLPFCLTYFVPFFVFLYGSFSKD